MYFFDYQQNSAHRPGTSPVVFHVNAVKPFIGGLAAAVQVPDTHENNRQRLLALGASSGALLFIGSSFIQPGWKIAERFVMRSLIVEDDALARMLLLSILSRYGECDVVENGEEAVQRVSSSFEENTPYDIMCLDIVMPILGGQEALSQIRSIERGRGIKEHKLLKVIMVTAIEDFDNIMQAFEGGHCEAYLAKPVREEELLEHLYDLELIEEMPLQIERLRGH